VSGALIRLKRRGAKKAKGGKRGRKGPKGWGGGGRDEGWLSTANGGKTEYRRLCARAEGTRAHPISINDRSWMSDREKGSRRANKSEGVT
jgi:hypothetical protein